MMPPRASRQRTEPSTCAFVSCRNVLSDALMGPGMVVIHGVHLQHTPKMPFVQDEEMVEAFLANSSGPALSERVYLGGLECRADDGYFFRPEYRIQCSCGPPTRPPCDKMGTRTTSTTGKFARRISNGRPLRVIVPMKGQNSTAGH